MLDRNIYGSEKDFKELLKYLETKEHHKGKLKTYYKWALTEEQSTRLGEWLCGGTGEFWWYGDKNIFNE
jgi:hypothetical protein